MRVEFFCKFIAVWCHFAFIVMASGHESISLLQRWLWVNPSSSWGFQHPSCPGCSAVPGSAGRSPSDTQWVSHLCLSLQNHTESQNVGVGRDLCGSSSPTLLPKQGHLQQAAQDLVQAGLEYLQRRRLHSLPGQPVPGLRHPPREEVLPHVQTELPVPQFVPIAPCPVTGHHLGARKLLRRSGLEVSAELLPLRLDGQVGPWWESYGSCGFPYAVGRFWSSSAGDLLGRTVVAAFRCDELALVFRSSVSFAAEKSNQSNLVLRRGSTCPGGGFLRQP